MDNLDYDWYFRDPTGGAWMTRAQVTLTAMFHGWVLSFLDEPDVRSGCLSGIQPDIEFGGMPDMQPIEHLRPDNCSCIRYILPDIWYLAEYEIHYTDRRDLQHPAWHHSLISGHFYIRAIPTFLLVIIFKSTLACMCAPNCYYNLTHTLLYNIYAYQIRLIVHYEIRSY